MDGLEEDDGLGRQVVHIAHLADVLGVVAADAQELAGLEGEAGRRQGEEHRRGGRRNRGGAEGYGSADFPGSPRHVKPV